MILRAVKFTCVEQTAPMTSCSNGWMENIGKSVEHASTQPVLYQTTSKYTTYNARTHCWRWPPQYSSHKAGSGRIETEDWPVAETSWLSPEQSPVSDVIVTAPSVSNLSAAFCSEQWSGSLVLKSWYKRQLFETNLNLCDMNSHSGDHNEQKSVECRLSNDSWESQKCPDHL